MFQPLHRVAVVDDDYISLFLITKFLGKNQITESVLPFTNGIEALTFLTNFAADFSKLPEIILLDIKMPQFSGWQFLEKLTTIRFAVGYEPAVCILSAEPATDFELSKKWNCIKGHILKPIRLDELVSMIDSITAATESKKMKANMEVTMYNQ
jgi:CheY-like chemotaxis protein